MALIWIFSYYHSDDNGDGTVSDNPDTLTCGMNKKLMKTSRFVVFTGESLQSVLFSLTPDVKWVHMSAVFFLPTTDMLLYFHEKLQARQIKPGIVTGSLSNTSCLFYKP